MSQCGAYGWWIGPFTYQCDAELLHDITSHPATKHYQQLAYVGWQVARRQKSYKKWFLFMRQQQWMYDISKAGWQDDIWQCTIPSHTSQVSREPCAEGLFPSTIMWDAMICDTETRSIPWGNVKTWRTSQSRGEKAIPSQDGLATYPWEVILESTCVGKKKERKLCSEHFIVPGALNFLKSARSTELS